MANTPVASSGVKRQRTTTTPIPRKRARQSPSTKNDAASSSSKRRRSDQYTLTQIDFVKSSSFEQNESIAELEPLSVQPRVRVKREPVKTRDSTLTQMDFFSNPEADGSYVLDETPLEIAESLQDATLPSLPSFDGAMSDTEQISVQRAEMPPPRARGRKSRMFTEAAKSESAESQEYRPRKKRKEGDAPDSTMSSRRRSARNVHSDVASVRPSMVVQDSTDFDEISMHEGSSKLLGMVDQPLTPKKKRDRIPSSQTPESIRPSTRRRSVRQPLAELSANVQISPSKTVKSKPAVRRDKSSVQSTPRPSKICVLKVPPKALLPRKSREDDSQQDIWSLQPTSSPKSAGSQSAATKAGANKTHPSIETDSSTHQNMSLVIEESSDIGGNMDTQKSLPNLDDVFPDISASRKIMKQHEGTSDLGKTAMSPNRAREIEIEAESFKNNSGLRIQEEPVNMIPELGQVESDALSDLGDPVANDTQYVKDLYRRISSPAPSSSNNQQQSRAATVPTQGRSFSPSRTAPKIATAPGSPVIPSPLPQPKLVHSPNHALVRQTTNSNLPTLPTFATAESLQGRSSERVTITQVPLNDTNDYQQSSFSSPILPSAPLLTQKSIYPASFPHPSQVSTQAPSSQWYPPASQTQYSSRTNKNTEVERILIKDSSSVPGRLSQFPEHLDSELDDEDDFDFDLDLDASAYQAVKSRKRSEEGTNFIQKEDVDEVTQTPTQKSRHSLGLKRRTTTQSSPILLAATTRSQRDAELEVIALPSSSPGAPENDETPRPKTVTPRRSSRNITQSSSTRDHIEHSQNTSSPHPLADEMLEALPGLNQRPPSSSLSSTNLTPSPPRVLKRKYSPLSGFDNDTQSDFTQGGHVTAAYIHRAHEEGWLPKNYVPKPYKVKNWSKSMYQGSKSKKRKGGS